MYSRFEENTLSFAESAHMQQRIASFRTIKDTTGDGSPGKLLPATFHGSPLKRKQDAEDALAVVNRRGRPHLMITITCNPLWPEITENLEPHQSASDRPVLCCRVFKIKVAQIMTELKSGRVYTAHMFFVNSLRPPSLRVPFLRTVWLAGFYVTLLKVVSSISGLSTFCIPWVLCSFFLLRLSYTIHGIFYQAGGLFVVLDGDTGSGELRGYAVGFVV